jgi:5-formyltetrahydrofolate cyclo-ligase
MIGVSGRDAADALRSTKDAFRTEMRAVRSAIPADVRASRSRMIADRLLAIPEIERTRRCLTFLSFGSEVSTQPVLAGLRSRGVSVAVPVLDGGEMQAVELRDGARLVPSSYGAMEPEERAAVRPEEIDLVVAPGLAYDRSGRRLGYGGGYFDGFLRRVRSDCAVAGVCFAEQVVDEVPAGPDDVAVGLVVSDAEVIRPANL